MRIVTLALSLLLLGEPNALNTILSKVDGPRPLLLVNERVPSPLAIPDEVRLITRDEMERRMLDAGSATIVELGDTLDDSFVITRGDGREWNRSVAAIRNGELVQERVEWWLADESHEPAQKLDGTITAPAVVKRVEPNYSQTARLNRISGIVILESHIEKSGRISHIKTLRGLPLGVTNDAIAAVKQWQFKPGMVGEKPVDVVFNLTINFKLRE